MKRRLVARNYSDLGATHTAIKDLTIHWFSQLLLFSIEASTKGMKMFTHDISQTYVQSDTKLKRVVYITTPEEMNLKPGTVIRVIHPLQEIPESGLHFYITYLIHHTEQPWMVRSNTDSCVLIQRKNERLTGIKILQVDDTMEIRTQGFLEEGK